MVCMDAWAIYRRAAALVDNTTRDARTLVTKAATRVWGRVKVLGYLFFLG